MEQGWQAAKVGKAMRPRQAMQHRQAAETSRGRCHPHKRGAAF